MKTEHIIRGLQVVVENPYPNIETAFVLERLDAALGLIERFQPIRFRHLKRDAAYIWVARYACRGAYFPAERAILTEITFLNKPQEHPPAEVASSILHEGVHARLDRMAARLGFARRWSAADEERLCRRAEVRFGRALPADIGDVVLRRVEPILEHASDEEVAPAIDWRVARMRQMERDLQDMAVPKWAHRPLLALARWRIGRLS